MKIEKRVVDAKRGIVQITTLDERWYEVTKETSLYYPSSSWIASYYPKGKQFEKWLMDKGIGEAEQIKMQAGNRGSKVHQAIELLLNKQEVKIDDTLMNQDGLQEEISVEEWEAIMSFVDWYNVYKPELISVETTVLNEKYGYAGTLDLKCRINGEVCIVDHKTSSAIYPSHEIQLSSYKHADGNEDVTKMYILQLGYKLNKNRYKFTEIDDQFDIFLATKQLWHNENKNVVPKQKDYPLSLKL